MRKSKPKKRILLPDPKFNDKLVTRFVNDLMVDGKKSVSYQVFYGAMDIIDAKMKDVGLTPLDIWKKALENIGEMSFFHEFIYLIFTYNRYFITFILIN